MEISEKKIKEKKDILWGIKSEEEGGGRLIGIRI